MNDDNPSSGAEGGNDTIDKVYLLSIDEVHASSYGFSSEYYQYSDTRLAVNTEYARAQGASTSFDCTSLGSGGWWLRSTGRNLKWAAYVGSSGYNNRTGTYVFSGYAVRPVLHLNLAYSDLYAYAGTISTDGRRIEVAPPTPAPDTDITGTATPTPEPGTDNTDEPTLSPGNTPAPDGNPNEGASANPDQTTQPGNSSQPLPTDTITTSPEPTPTLTPVTAPPVSKVKSLKAKAGKKQLTITWKKVSGAAGYQVQVSTKKNFSGAKKIAVSKSKKKYIASKLKAAKKYYVRIRAYKTYNDSAGKKQNAYGKWMKVSKKTK